MTDKIVVLVTCGSKKEALRLARAIVAARLAACVNVQSAPLRSVYRWKAKVQEAREWLLLMKSTRKRFAALQREIARMHSYDVPEIIALPILSGSPAYLSWLSESVREPKKRTARRRAPRGRP